MQGHNHLSLGFEAKTTYSGFFFAKVRVEYGLVFDALKEGVEVVAAVKVNDFDLFQQTLNYNFVEEVALSTTNSTHNFDNLAFGHRQLNFLLVGFRLRSEGVKPFFNDTVYFD